MRLITWNCRVGAFRRKAAVIAPLNADVLVVPECEDIRNELVLDGTPQPTYRHWTGATHSTTTRGVGVLPFTVEVGPAAFQIVAVWTSETADRKTSSRQAHEGIDRHRDWITARDTVIVGDFNAANRDGYRSNWRDLMARIEPLGLVSAYHVTTGEQFGAETRPTASCPRRGPRGSRSRWARTRSAASTATTRR